MNAEIAINKDHREFLQNAPYWKNCGPILFDDKAMVDKWCIWIDHIAEQPRESLEKGILLIFMDKMISTISMLKMGVDYKLIAEALSNVEQVDVIINQYLCNYVHPEEIEAIKAAMNKTL